MTRQHHRGWRKNRERKYRIFPGYVRLPLEDLPTLLSDRFPVAIPRRNGGHVWRFADPTRGTQRSLNRLTLFKVEWDWAIENLRAEGLTAAMNDRGFVSVRYADVTTRKAIELERQRLSDLLFFAGAKDLAEYFQMQHGFRPVLLPPGPAPRLRVDLPVLLGTEERRADE